MKKTGLIKCSILISAVFSVGCVANGDGNNAMNSVGSGLESIEQAAQTGRQIVNAGTAVANNVDGMSLTSALVNQLGVSQQQALGGAGAIFQVAKESMTQEVFATLSQSIPDMNNMLNAAPAASGSLSGLAGGLSAMMGGGNNTLSNVTFLATSFQKLNLSPDMVGQFIPVVTDYVKGASGQAAANLLQSILPLP